MKKNDEAITEITGITAEGSGVGHVDGMAVFVPFTAVGDVAKIRILKVKKNFAYAKLLSLEKPSETRVEPDCPVFGKCGGCTFRHLAYSEELRIKEQRVADALSRIGGIKTAPQKIVGCDITEGYRNKAQYPVGGSPAAIGFYAANSHRIVPCGECRLQPASFGTMLAVFQKWIEKFSVSVYDEESGKGILRHIFFRRAPATGETVVTAVIKGKRLPHTQELIEELCAANPEICGFVLNFNDNDTNVILGSECQTLWGKAEITDVLCGLRFSVSPLSFYQVNSAQTEKLYRLAGEAAALTGSETVLDLYCGAGTIGMTLAAKAKRVVGVEIVPEAIENAKRNAADNKIENIEFICGDAAEIKKRDLKAEVIVLDPPRKGCDKELVETVAAMSPERIVYISCNPATLARDCAVFSDCGYTLLSAVPVDMFPKTPHVECVALLTKELI